MRLARSLFLVVETPCGRHYTFIIIIVTAAVAHIRDNYVYTHTRVYIYMCMKKKHARRNDCPCVDSLLFTVRTRIIRGRLILYIDISYFTHTGIRPAARVVFPFLFLPSLVRVCFTATAHHTVNKTTVFVLSRSIPTFPRSPHNRL